MLQSGQLTSRKHLIWSADKEHTVEHYRAQRQSGLMSSQVSSSQKRDDNAKSQGGAARQVCRAHRGLSAQSGVCPRSAELVQTTKYFFIIQKCSYKKNEIYNACIKHQLTNYSVLKRGEYVISIAPRPFG